SVERPNQQFGHKARVGGIQVVRLPAENPQLHDVSVLIRHTEPGTEEHAGRRGEDSRAGRVVLQLILPGVVEIRYIQRVAPTGEQQPRECRDAKRSHGSVLRVWWSEADVDSEPETATGRERCNVNVPRDRLIAEVADFGVEPVVGRGEEQVFGADGEPGVPG